MRFLSLLPVLLLISLYCKCCSALHCSSSPYAAQIPEYTVCQIEDQTENPYDATNTEDCDHTSMLPFAPCEGPDNTHDSPSVHLCWRIQDLNQGSVEVTFPLWPQHCNYTRYDVTLMVYEAESCAASSSIEDFKKHSRKEITIQDCTSSSCVNKCRRRGSLVFQHLFSGCYQLYMTPRRHYLALQQLVSHPVLITTEYKKTSLSMLTPVVYLSPKQTDLTLTVNFPIVPAASHLTLSYGINMSLGQHACRSTGHPFATCITCLGSSEIQCNHVGSASVTSCSYQGENVVRCSFPGMKAGNYCVRIQYDDERCVADSVWNEISDDNHSPCTWDAFQQYVPAVSSVAVNTTRESHIHPALLTLLVLIVIAICGVTGFVVYRRALPSHPHFLPVHHKPLQLSEQPTVLLLYARDCESFMEAVAQLRSLMRRVYNCQVMDCWDESQYSSVSQSPVRWLQSLLSNPRVRCVLLTSPASLLHEAALLHSVPVRYTQPRAFDSVFTHALSCLHESSLQDSYKRVFIVRLGSGTEGALPIPKVRTFLNPLTTYVLPIHLQKLMSCIYSLDSPVCSITADNSAEVSLFSDAIAEYQRQLEDNPRYLDTLMVSSTGTPLHQLLA